MSSVATRPSATSAPARRSESCSFIWHPKVRMWNVRVRARSARRTSLRSRGPAWCARLAVGPRVRCSPGQGYGSLSHPPATMATWRWPPLPTPSATTVATRARRPHCLRLASCSARWWPTSTPTPSSVPTPPPSMPTSPASSAWWWRPRPSSPPGSPPRATGRPRATGHRPACWPPWRAAPPGRPSAPSRPGSACSALPSVEEALRAGPAVGPEGRRDRRGRHAWTPGASPCCWPDPSTSPCRATRERCQRFRATARAERSPGRRPARPRRTGRSPTGPSADGAFHYKGQDTPERGAALLARLVPTANRLREARRAAAADRADRHSVPSPRRRCGPMPSSSWSPAGSDGLGARGRPIDDPPCRLPRPRRSPGPRRPSSSGSTADALQRGRAAARRAVRDSTARAHPGAAGPGPGRRLVPQRRLHRGRRHPGRQPSGADHQPAGSAPPSSSGTGRASSRVAACPTDWRSTTSKDGRSAGRPNWRIWPCSARTTTA